MRSKPDPCRVRQQIHLGPDQLIEVSLVRPARDHVDLAIWVETDMQVAQTRGLERDGPDGRDFWFEWQASEKPFLEADKPWDRAKMIVDGAPNLEHDPNTEFVTIKNWSAQHLA